MRKTNGFPEMPVVPRDELTGDLPRRRCFDADLDRSGLVDLDAFGNQIRRANPGKYFVNGESAMRLQR